MSLGRFASDALQAIGLGNVAKPENLRARKLSPQHSAAAATLQTFTFDLPTDRLIHSILISIGESTTASGETEQGTLANDLTDIKVDSNMGPLKEMTAGMCQAIMKMNQDNPSTGFYKLYFTDVALKTRPLPSWIFSSLQLKVTGNAPAASNYHHVRVSVVESEVPSGLNLADWRILVERYIRNKRYGTSTGWQTYDHEKAYKVLGYLYAMDDNATLSATIFDRLTVLGIKPEGEFRITDEQWINHIIELNTETYMVALGTGYFYMEFPDALDTAQFSRGSLISKLNVPTAGTDAGLRVLERFLK